MQVVGDEPNHHRERRTGATGCQGFEGGCISPSPDAQCGTLSGLAHGA